MFSLFVELFPLRAFYILSVNNGILLAFEAFWEAMVDICELIYSTYLKIMGYSIPIEGDWVFIYEKHYLTEGMKRGKKVFFFFDKFKTIRFKVCVFEI